MATDYALNLKATLDTSDVQQKLQALGQTGGMAFDSLERAVKNLDSTLKTVSSSLKVVNQQNANMNLSTARLLRVSSRYVGSQVLGAAQQHFKSTGDYATAGLFGIGQGALAGAAAGTAFGPAGTAIGASAGILTSTAQAMKDLDDQSKALAEKFQKLANIKIKLFDDVLAHGERVRQSRRLESVSGMSDTQLRLVANQERAKISRYEEAALSGGANLAHTDAQRKARLDKLEKEADFSRKMVDAIEAEEKKRQQAKEKKVSEQEKEAREKESRQKTAGTMLSRYEKAREMETFTEQVGQMSPKALADLAESLGEQRYATGEKFQKALQQAKETGAGADLENAGSLGAEYDTLTEKLKLATNALDSLVNLQESTDFNIDNEPGLKELIQEPVGSMQEIGYSTLGNIGFDTFRETKQLEERTAQNTQKTADAVSQMKTDVMEIKTKLQNSPGGSVYT